jgi:hypothetical protein
MPKKEDDLFKEIVEMGKNNTGTNKSWLDSLPNEDFKIIESVFKKGIKAGIPIIVIAKVVKQKYKVRCSPDSMARTITRRFK